jgi:simple sugar transport system ATP-binding protein
MTGAALELRGISKRFGSVLALDGADFVLARGEVHALLGENGAGKSTLMHVAYGLLEPDGGSIRIGGQAATLRSPRDARQRGIGMVHQHFTSIPAFTVAENLWLAAGRLGSPMGRPPIVAADEPLRAKLWEGLDPNARVETLPVGAQQRLEVLQALATRADILLLDEPTAVLTPAEVQQLLALLREFAAGGGSVVIITHKLDEVFASADRVTVLRRGRVVLQGNAAEQSRSGLARAMVGESIPAATAEMPVPRVVGSGPVRARSGGLEARGGEITGIAAVEGNGQRELLRGLAGIGPAAPGQAVEQPVGFLPEDRTTEGLIPRFSLTENMVLGLPNDPRWRRGPWLEWRRATERASALLAEYDVRAAGPNAPARTLSGGNQQKLLFGRMIEGRPAVVVAENPTRGLDLHAAAFVHERLRKLADEGAAVIVYSTDLDEVLSLADRIFVVRRGTVIPAPPGADRLEVGALMLGTE